MNVWENVAALVAATITAGELTRTKGYTAEGDGGEGTYLIQTLGDYGLTPDEQGAAFTIANGNIAVLQVDKQSISLKTFGAKGDGVTDDSAVANAAMSSPVNGEFYADGNHIFKSVVTLRSDKYFIIPANSKVTWAGAAGGTVFDTPSASVLVRAGLLCLGGFIDMVDAGFGLATSSHQSCKFDLEFDGDSDTSRAVWVRGNSTTRDGSLTDTTNSVNNEYLRVWHLGICGELIRLTGVNVASTGGNSPNGGIITLNNFGPMRASFSTLGGVFADGWVDTNNFKGLITIRLFADNSFGLQLGDDITIYQLNFGQFSIGPYNSFTGRTGVSLGAGNRQITIDHLFVDGDLDTENGNFVADPATQSYRVSQFHNLGIPGVALRQFVRSDNRRATSYSGENDEFTIADDGVATFLARTDYLTVIFNANQQNANGMVWFETRTGLAKSKKLAGDATLFDVTTGVLVGGGGTDLHFTVSVEDGVIYMSNRLGFTVKVLPTSFGNFRES